MFFMANAFLVFYEDICDDEEGDSYSWGVLSEGIPRHADWMNFARVANDTFGLERGFVEEIDDLQRHIDDLVRKEKELFLGYAVLDCETGIILNSRGETQEERFDGNTEFMKVVSLGHIDRADRLKPGYKSDIVSEGPIFLGPPFRMEAYTFRECGNRVDQVFAKTSELMKIAGCV